MKKIIVAIVCGIILGVLCSKFIFVGSGVSLIPWAIVGLFLGFWSKSRKEALITGGVYGFVLSFVFMLAGYTGTAPIVTRIPFFVILGIFGGVCGVILSFLGNIISSARKK